MNWAEFEKWKLQQRLEFFIGVAIRRLQELSGGYCTGRLFGNCLEDPWGACRTCRAYMALKSIDVCIETNPGLAAGMLATSLASLGEVGILKLGFGEVSPDQLRLPGPSEDEE